MTITRDAMPSGRIPRCCPFHREETLNALGWLLAVDVHDTVADMIRGGWPPAVAADEARRWFGERMDEAIAAGAAVAAATHTVPLCPSCATELNGGYCHFCREMHR